MPAELRTGQWMFYNANDRYQMFPITVNRWLSCESCHTDGGTAAATQRLAVGPRDIPDLRQGLDGFFMRTATRRDLSDPRTAQLVAEAVGDLATLQLLRALTEADSKATGQAL